MKKKNNKKKLPKYNQGGDLATQMLGLGLNAVLPGAGSVVAPIVGGIINQVQQKKQQSELLNNHYNSVKVNTNPYGYMKNGGELSGSTTVPMFEGLDHNNGGIEVSQDGLPSDNPVAEVEDGETKYTIKGKTIIFSKSLRL